MKTRQVKKMKWLLALSSLAVLASCGGGGGDAGDAAEFAVIPNEFKLKALKGDVNCQNVAGVVTNVTIVGGQPPFRIVNSFPDYFSVDKTQVSGKDPQFKITSRTGCAEDLTVLVLDAFSNSATVAYTVEKGDEATE